MEEGVAAQGTVGLQSCPGLEGVPESHGCSDTVGDFRERLSTKKEALKLSAQAPKGQLMFLSILRQRGGLVQAGPSHGEKSSKK